MFDHNEQHHICRKPDTAYQHKHLILTVSHSCGDDLSLFAATGPWRLPVIEPTMNSFAHQSFPESNMCLTSKDWPQLGHVTR